MKIDELACFIIQFLFGDEKFLILILYWIWLWMVFYLILS